MRDLPTLGGPTNAAEAINNASQVVGSSSIGATSFQNNGFLWTAAGGMLDLGGVLMYSRRAVAINEHGDILMTDFGSWFQTPIPAQTFVRWADGTNQSVGTLGGSNTAGLTLTDSRVAYGTSQRCPNCTAYDEFMWTQSAGIQRLVLNYPGDANKAMAAVNANGEIVGSTNAASGSRRALWNVAGQHSTPCASASTFGTAYDINNSSLIVGEWVSPDGSIRHAFLCYPNGTFVDLSPLQGFSQSVARALSNGSSGLWIVGDSYNSSGDRRATLWRVQ
jgi:probable HAF family extracellular repeat protein